MSQEKEAQKYIAKILEQMKNQFSGDEESILIRTAQELVAEAKFWSVMRNKVQYALLLWNKAIEVWQEFLRKYESLTRQVELDKCVWYAEYCRKLLQDHADPVASIEQIALLTDEQRGNLHYVGQFVLAYQRGVEELCDPDKPIIFGLEWNIILAINDRHEPIDNAPVAMREKAQDLLDRYCADRDAQLLNREKTIAYLHEKGAIEKDVFLFLKEELMKI